MSPQFSPLVQESFLEEEIPESPQRRGQLQVRRTPSYEFASLNQREVSCGPLIPIFGMGRHNLVDTTQGIPYYSNAAGWPRQYRHSERS